MWVLAPTLRRHVRDGSFNKFQERLLNAFTGDIPRDGRAIAFSTNLVDFVDIYNPALSAFDIVVGGLKQF